MGWVALIEEIFENINLIEELENKNWCKNFENLLESLQDNDSREKIYKSMLNLTNLCKNKWSQNAKIVNKLKEHYKLYLELHENDKLNDDSDDYYFTISTLINEILTSFTIKQEL